MSRQNTIGSQDGGRSVRASKRYSHTALYLSMSAQDRDLEIEDELARGELGMRGREGGRAAGLHLPEWEGTGLMLWCEKRRKLYGI